MKGFSVENYKYAMKGLTMGKGCSNSMVAFMEFTILISSHISCTYILLN